MAEQLMSENHGPWTLHGGEHCGVRIDGPNGRAVLHVIQRDPHPALGQGITQAESEAIARRIVELWNAALTADPVVAAWLRNDGMKAMPADEKEAWIEAGQPEIAEDYTIPLYRNAGVKVLPAAHWRCACGAVLKGGATHMNCPAGSDGVSRTDHQSNSRHPLMPLKGQP